VALRAFFSNQQLKQLLLTVLIDCIASSQSHWLTLIRDPYQNNPCIFMIRYHTLSGCTSCSACIISSKQQVRARHLNQSLKKKMICELVKSNNNRKGNQIIYITDLRLAHSIYRIACKTGESLIAF
jgi:hypothetical protein